MEVSRPQRCVIIGHSLDRIFRKARGGVARFGNGLDLKSTPLCHKARLRLVNVYLIIQWKRRYNLVLRQKYSTLFVFELALRGSEAPVLENRAIRTRNMLHLCQPSFPPTQMHAKSSTVHFGFQPSYFNRIGPNGGLEFGLAIEQNQEKLLSQHHHVNTD